MARLKSSENDNSDDDEVILRVKKKIIIKSDSDLTKTDCGNQKDQQCQDQQKQQQQQQRNKTSSAVLSASSSSSSSDCCNNNNGSNHLTATTGSPSNVEKKNRIFYIKSYSCVERETNNENVHKNDRNKRKISSPLNMSDIKSLLENDQIEIWRQNGDSFVISNINENSLSIINENYRPSSLSSSTSMVTSSSSPFRRESFLRHSINTIFRRNSNRSQKSIIQYDSNSITLDNNYDKNLINKENRLINDKLKGNNNEVMYNENLENSIGGGDDNKILEENEEQIKAEKESNYLRKLNSNKNDSNNKNISNYSGIINNNNCGNNATDHNRVIRFLRTGSMSSTCSSSGRSTSSVSFGIRSPPGSPMAPLQSHSETHGQSIIGLNTIGKSPSHLNTNKLDSKSSKQSSPLTPVTASTGRNISPHPQKSSTSLIPAKNEIPEKEKKRKELSSSRQKKFHRHFQQVPKDERVLNYFSCALVSDILLQGHLYITEQHFAFYSNVFGFVTKLLIPTASVIKISKEKTAKIIPNAVGVATADERHVFGSFMSREAAFRLMCSVCLPQLEPVENIPPKIPDVEVSEEYSVEDDSSCSISGNESPPQIVDSNTTTTSTSDASQAIRQRKIPAIEAPKTSELIVNDVVDGKSEDIPNSVKSITATSISCSSSSTPIKISTSPPPRIVSSPYTIKIKFPTDFHVVYLGLVLTIVLALLSGFLLYRILDIEAKTSYRNSLDFKWDADTDEDVYAKALKWQKEMQTKSTEEAQSILNTNLEQIAKVRRSLETLSLLIHDKNIENDSNQNNDRGYERDTNSMYHQQEETT